MKAPVMLECYIAFRIRFPGNLHNGKEMRKYEMPKYRVSGSKLVRASEGRLTWATLPRQRRAVIAAVTTLFTKQEQSNPFLSWAAPPGGMRGTCPPPPVQNSGRDVPPKIAVFRENFAISAKMFGLSNISKIKWVKSEEKSEFGDRCF